jgi:hypothetical protein
MVKIEQVKVEKAWENWLEFHYGLDCDELMERFENFVNRGGKNPTSIDPWSLDCDDEIIEVLPSVAKSINMLVGPHYPTLIKAWYVRNPWKK